MLKHKFDLYLIENNTGTLVKEFDTHEEASVALLNCSAHLRDFVLEIRFNNTVIARMKNRQERPLHGGEIYKSANLLKSLGINLQ